ncbi:MAG: hypothetical protein PUP93_19150 [Rhizonema sp. NSF051]|nr:hypothetical protein [Rhizonema sp. NSF051]
MDDKTTESLSSFTWSISFAPELLRSHVKNQSPTTLTDTEARMGGLTSTEL